LTIAETKRFNASGPCLSRDHYALPRHSILREIMDLADRKRYFVLKGPPRSGKTTLALAARDELNKTGKHLALYCDLDSLRSVPDPGEAMSAVAANLLRDFDSAGVETATKDVEKDALAKLSSKSAREVAGLRVFLTELSAKLSNNLVIFFDNADCLPGPVLMTFLLQLKTGRENGRQNPFPGSVAFVGRRSVQDLKLKTRPESALTSSFRFFDVISEVLTAADFTPTETRTLYSQHAKATGQVFKKAAARKAWRWTEGQPGLINALAREVVENILSFDYGEVVTASLVDKAADNVMKRRDAHMNSLLANLKDPAMLSFLEPMFSAAEKKPRGRTDLENALSFHDDLRSILDSGLVKQDRVSLRPANPIHATVIARILNKDAKSMLSTSFVAKWLDDKTIDANVALKGFRRFFEHVRRW
jgi:hypothetical protein